MDDIGKKEVNDIDINDIIKRIKNNDETALEEIIDKYHFLVNFVVRKFIKANDDVDFIINNVFHCIWNLIGMYNPQKGLFSSWISKIASNASLSYLRKKRTNEKYEKLHKELFYNEHQSSLTILDELEETNLDLKNKNILSSNIHKILTINEYECIVLRYQYNMTPTEIERSALPISRRTICRLIASAELKIKNNHSFLR